MVIVVNMKILYNYALLFMHKSSHICDCFVLPGFVSSSSGLEVALDCCPITSLQEEML